MKLLEIEAKTTFNGGFNPRLINPAAIANVDFPDYFDTSYPGVEWVKVSMGSGAEYIMTNDVWEKILIHMGTVPTPIR